MEQNQQLKNTEKHFLFISVNNRKQDYESDAASLINVYIWNSWKRITHGAKITRLLMGK